MEQIDQIILNKNLSIFFSMKIIKHKTNNQQSQTNNKHKQTTNKHKQTTNTKKQQTQTNTIDSW